MKLTSKTVVKACDRLLARGYSPGPRPRDGHLWFIHWNDQSPAGKRPPANPHGLRVAKVRIKDAKTEHIL